MKTYFVKTPKFISAFYAKYIWRMATKKKEIYLTFDDGPTPKVTEFVLDELKKHQAKATFFCIGKNIKNNPTIYKRILTEGHQIGNHTQNHLNGWKTKQNNYVDNVKECQAIIEQQNLKQQSQTSKLFRPPYGKIKKSQAQALLAKGYKIIMWSVLSGDFDTKLSKEKCLTNVIKNIKKGDIIVFHDSEKARLKLEYVLPKMLQYFTDREFEFKNLQ